MKMQGLGSVSLYVLKTHTQRHVRTMKLPCIAHINFVHDQRQEGSKLTVKTTRPRKAET